jgi:two-component system chemotaxis response regulator CheY
MIFLVVDDSRPARNLIKNYTSEIIPNRYDEYLEAENGEATLQLLETRRVDFVFLDLNLSSKMTGMDVLREIRKLDKFKQLPIMMVSGESDKQNVIESLKHGATGFIVKPIDKKVFAEKVLKVIKTIT